MNLDAPTALRYLAGQAARCRDKDEGEMVCLLIVPLCRVLDLEPMEDSREEAAFSYQFKRELERMLDRSPAFPRP